MRTKITKDVINQRLHNWNIKVFDYQKTKIILSNGVILLSRREILLFQQRISKKFDMDLLYHIDPAVRYQCSYQLKRAGARRGGLAVQQKYDSGEYTRKIGIIGAESPKKGIPSNITPWNKGKSKQNDKRLHAISKNRTGSGNPMFGKPQSNTNKQIASKRMSQAILDGSFTPNTQNSRTHWQYSYQDKKFRSSWEVAWFALNPHFEFEKIRIPYMFNGQYKIYIVDFVDPINHILVEIKPKEHFHSAKFTAKRMATTKWCEENNYQYLIVDQQYFIKNMIAIQNSDLPNEVKIKIKAIR